MLTLTLKDNNHLRLMKKMLQNSSLIALLVFLFVGASVNCQSETKHATFALFPSVGVSMPMPNDFQTLYTQLQSQFEESEFLGFKQILANLPDNVKEKKLSPSDEVVISAIKKIDPKCQLLCRFSVDFVAFEKIAKPKKGIPLPITKYALFLKYTVRFIDLECSKLIDKRTYKEKEEGSVLSEEENKTELARLKSRLLLIASRRASSKIAKISRDFVEEPTLLIINSVKKTELLAKLLTGDTPKIGMILEIVMLKESMNSNSKAPKKEYSVKGKAIVLAVKNKVVRLKIVSGEAKSGYYLRQQG